MLDSNGCAGLPISGLHSPRLGANYVSPLQKAVNRKQSFDSSSWLKQCYDVVVSSADPDLSLSLPIDGGSDAGMFCVIGAQLDSTRLVYHPIDSTQCSQERLKSGDIILSFNQYEISGFTRRDAIDLCDYLTRVSNNTASSARPRVRIRLTPPQALSTGSTMLSSFLAAAFSLNSPEYALQEKIRENVYQRVVPCTTRLPRADEIDGVHYRFLSVPQFLTLERSGQLLESGVYKGNHYGTPRPEPNATALESIILNHFSLSTPSCDYQSNDDSCAIPPPLPPLASLSNVAAVQSPKSSPHLVRQPPLIQHPPPPRPPLRQSSISSQTTSSCNDKPSSADKHAVPDLKNESMQAETPKSYINGEGMRIQNKSYHLDCDISTEDRVRNQTVKVDALVDKGNSNVEGVDGSPTSSDIDKPLPYGWELIRDPDYGTFYIDHIRERTQYEPPTAEDYAMAAALQNQFWAAVNGNERKLVPATTVSQPSMDLLSRTVPDHRSSPLNQRVTPTKFFADKNQLCGPLVTLPLEKGPKGFGFTIVGGSDSERSAFLQVKHIIPGGPAALSNILTVGDVLVAMNGTNVLGFTHAELVDLLQSIPVGSSVQLTVSQGYHLSTERPESGISDTSITPPQTDPSEFRSVENGLPLIHSPSFAHNHVVSNAISDTSVLSTSSQTSITASPHISSSTASSHSGTKCLLDADQHSAGKPAIVVANRMRPYQRPEFLKVSILKQSNGFGFTLADHPQGQHVKAILDPVHCSRLQVGDVLVEINDRRVKEIPHAEVVHILKQCPVGREARLLIQRGGLYSAPWSVIPYAVHRERVNSSVALKEKPDFATTVHADPMHAPVMSPGGTTMGPVDSRVLENPVALRPHSRTVSEGLIDVNQSSDVYTCAHSQFTIPDYPRDSVFHQGDSAVPSRSPKMMNHSAFVVDRRRRTQPMDDSVLDYVKSGPSLESSQFSSQYGSLLRPRTRQLQHNGPDDRPGSRSSFLMLPGEFLVHLQRQSTGFGFNVVGGAEENSQVVIGSLVPGGAAQLSGVVRSGDRLVSVNGVRVVGAKHRDVVQLLEKAAYTVGQVTLGLQRPPDFKQRAPFVGTRDTVEVVVPRSPKGDGFGFFISNTHPSALSGGQSALSFGHPKPDGEFIAQLVAGSKAEQLGLLSVGDRIVAVNKVPISGLHHDQVVRLIRESGSHIVLDIIPSATSAWASGLRSHSISPGAVPIEFPVTLFRGSRGFGFSIRGGHEFDKMPLLVLRIVDGGAAQMDGRLKVGDELIEINGHSTVGMSHGRAIEIIQAGGNTMRLTVRRHAVTNSSTGIPVGMSHHRHANQMRAKADQTPVCGLHGKLT